MILHIYQQNALRTAPQPCSRHMPFDLDHMNHAALGLAGELIEILNHKDSHNLAEELGDLCWYVALECDGIGVPMEDIAYSHIKIEEPFSQLVDEVSALVDNVKRRIYYSSVEEPKIYIRLCNIMACIALIAQETEFTLEEILEKNIKKLRVRFPKAFNEECAVNRNTRKELEAYEN